MRIEVLYFAAAREAAGRPSEGLDVEHGTTIAALRSLLASRHPALAQRWRGLRFAVGERFEAEDRVLEAGDVVALIPPVSGG